MSSKYVELRLLEQALDDPEESDEETIDLHDDEEPSNSVTEEIRGIKECTIN
jgi:hypothetical protein